MAFCANQNLDLSPLLLMRTTTVSTQGVILPKLTRSSSHFISLCLKTKHMAEQHLSTQSTSSSEVRARKKAHSLQQRGLLHFQIPPSREELKLSLLPLTQAISMQPV